MLRYFGKKLKMKQSDIKTSVMGVMPSVVWEDEHNANMLTNMHHPPADGIFLGTCECSESSCSARLYRHMGYVQTYLTSLRTLPQSSNRHGNG
jgi:hypothetical protein